MTTKEVETVETTEAPTAHLYLVSALVKNETVLDHLSELITNHGATVKKAENLGLKQLSYPIKKQSSLYLVSVFFTAGKEMIAELEKEVNRDEQIERALITTWRGDIDAPERNRNRDRKEH